MSDKFDCWQPPNHPCRIEITNRPYCIPEGDEHCRRQYPEIGTRYEHQKAYARHHHQRCEHDRQRLPARLKPTIRERRRREIHQIFVFHLELHTEPEPESTERVNTLVNGLQQTDPSENPEKIHQPLEEIVVLKDGICELNRRLETL